MSFLRCATSDSGVSNAFSDTRWPSNSPSNPPHLVVLVKLRLAFRSRDLSERRKSRNCGFSRHRLKPVLPRPPLCQTDKSRRACSRKPQGARFFPRLLFLSAKPFVQLLTSYGFPRESADDLTAARVDQVNAIANQTVHSTAIGEDPSRPQTSDRPLPLRIRLCGPAWVMWRLQHPAI